MELRRRTDVRHTKYVKMFASLPAHSPPWLCIFFRNNSLNYCSAPKRLHSFLRNLRVSLLLSFISAFEFKDFLVFTALHLFFCIEISRFSWFYCLAPEFLHLFLKLFQISMHHSRNLYKTRLCLKTYAFLEWQQEHGSAGDKENICHAGWLLVK